jgi:hypothetical protein
MKFIERFGRLLGTIFWVLGLVIQIMCWVAGYTSLLASIIIISFLTIAIIADGASFTARKIMREEREAFKEIMDKAFKLDGGENK